MVSVRFTIVFALFSLVTANVVQNERKGKLFRFGYEYTTTEIKPFTIKSSVPYSCVHVEPTLPPCRNARFLGSFLGFGSSSTGNTDGAKNSSSPKSSRIETNAIHTTPLSWGEYLGFVAPTVTMDVTKITTATVADSSITVTFSVRGCRPSEMPLGLETCKISPSPTSLPIVPTLTNTGSTNQLASNTNQIQGSQADIPSSQSNVPTAGLRNSASN